MKMFEMLGLNPQKPFTKVSQPQTVEDSQFAPLGETKWSRPGHTIERNLEASGKEKINLESFTYKPSV
jgi:biotin synthase